MPRRHRGALIGDALCTLTGALNPPSDPEMIPEDPRLAWLSDPRYGQWHCGQPPQVYQPNDKSFRRRPFHYRTNSWPGNALLV